MNFIDSFCSNIKKVIALIALMLLLTLVILIFTHTSLGYAHNTADYLSFT